PAENSVQVDSLAEPVKSDHQEHNQNSPSATSAFHPRRRHRPVAASSAVDDPLTSSRKTTPMKDPNRQSAIPTDAELITELLNLPPQLRTTEQSLAAAARQLRARRKQQQLVKSTLASLKQLQTLGV